MFNYGKPAQGQTSKYKYELKDDYRYNLRSCYNGVTAQTLSADTNNAPYAEVANKLLTLRAGYAWNGANVIRDSDWNMRASCVHDALCQLLKQNEANWVQPPKNNSDYRRCADREWFCIVLMDKDIRTAKLTYSAIRGYVKGWYVGGFFGALFGFVRRNPTFACRAEADAPPGEAPGSSGSIGGPGVQDGTSGTPGPGPGLDWEVPTSSVSSVW